MQVRPTGLVVLSDYCKHVLVVNTSKLVKIFNNMFLAAWYTRSTTSGIPYGMCIHVFVLFCS